MSVPAGGSCVGAYPPVITSAWLNANSAGSPVGGVAGFLDPTLLGGGEWAMCPGLLAV